MKGIQSILGRALVLTTALLVIVNSSRADSGGYAVTSRGLDWNVLQKTTVEHGTNHVHRYVELSSGLNHTNNSGQLVPSSDAITILPTGGAIANQGRHTVSFPADLYNGALEVVSPDGRHLKSRPIGVTYDDGSNTVFIATLKSAQGYLTASNTVTYRDAFDGISADLVCRNRRNGFECDLVIKRQIQTPGQYGLDESFSSLQMVTEFFDTADPEQIPGQSDDWYGLQDATLKFGKLTMTRGKAFAFGTNTSIQHPASSIASPVYKRWFHAEGRTFLIESVPVIDIADDLNALPLTASIQKPVSPVRHSLGDGGSIKHLASSIAPVSAFPPSRFPLSVSTNQLLLATADISHEPGVVLDYNEIDTDQTDFCFAANTTYYVSGLVNLWGTATFEQGVVIKYDVGAELALDQPLPIFSTTPELPAILTAKDDDTVGEIISGSTGVPSGYYADRALDAEAEALLDMTNVLISYANVGLYICNESGNKVMNVEFEHCGTGIYVEQDWYFSFYNILMNDVGEAFIPNASSGNVVNWTVADCGTFVDYYGGDPNPIFITNTIFANVTNLTGGYGDSDLVGNYDGFFNSPNFGSLQYTNTFWPFQSAANANFYLAAGSPYLDAGTTSIDPDLLAELQTMTTYAPQDGGFPDTNTPDLGYHYPVNEDSDHDGIPDWWIWHWFGSYAYSGTNLDAGGSTFLSDYQSYADPNIITFSIEVTNNYVSTTNAGLQFNVTAGVPYFYTVSVDDTNYLADTNSWIAFASTNITASLGTNQGWHNLWVGVKGLPAEASVTWIWKRLKLDTLPPQLTVTSPASSTVDVPLIQIAGFCPEPLDTISYDLTNALGLVTNLDAGITSQRYDTNTWDFTTNYFECLDIPLTNGVNIVIIHATDLAGNLTVTNFTFTVDYSSKTNPPIVQITWPQDGMNLSSTNFTLRGQVNDPTVTVTASITDTNGDTNVISGVVERNGRFWLEGLPLNTGTNALSITISDVVSNTTTTNLNLVPSGLALAMAPVSDDSQLWQPAISVGGTISDSSYAVWVNGVQGTNNGDGTWSADNVPVSPGGVANFDLTAYPPAEAPASSYSGGGVNPRTANAVNASVDRDKQAQIFTSYYVEGDGGSSSAIFYPGPFIWTFDWTAQNFSLWFAGAGGLGSSYWETHSDNIDGSGGFSHARYTVQFSSPSSPSPTDTPGTEYDDYFDEGDGFGIPYTSTSASYTNYPLPSVVWEHCSVNLLVNVKAGWPYQWTGSWFPESPENTGAYHRVAQAGITLETGGKARSNRQNLFKISGSAGVVTDEHAFAVANYDGGGYHIYPSGTQDIPKQDIIIDGLPLGSDGNQWRAYKDGDTRDVTPRVKNVDYYTFDIGQQKYKLNILANDYPLADDRVRPHAYYCVGQKLNFQALFTPSLSPPIIQYTWNYTADYVNNHWTDANNCEEYNIAPIPAMSNPTVAWFYNKQTQDATATLGLYCKFENGQSVYLIRHGKFNVFTPSIGFSTAGTPTVNVRHYQIAAVMFGVGQGDGTGALGMSAYINSIPKFPGQAIATQLVNRQASIDGIPLGTGGLIELDTAEIYPDSQASLTNDPAHPSSNLLGTVTVIDQPAIPITTASWAHGNDQFNTFFRFKPDGDSDNIYVTLGRADWGWHGNVDYTGGIPYNSWTLSNWTISGAGTYGPTFYLVNDFPVWVGIKSSFP